MPPLRVLACPDSFKGSLTAAEAARAMARGVKQSLPGARVVVLPLADGGEGTLDALAALGTRHVAPVSGPLGAPVRAASLFLRDGTAVVETAQAAGLLLVPRGKRDPLRATTFGVGQLIADAVLRAGATRIVVALGGSATVDGGSGMARALGARLLDRAGKPIPPGGAGLLLLHAADNASAGRLLRGVRVTGITDVSAPLLGPRGAARVFGPQKGATPAQVRSLERGLANLARVLKRDLRVDVASAPGAGAAGGLGAGLLAFAGARLSPGAPWLFAHLGVASLVAAADLILTGEGNLDASTGMGKLVARVAAEGRRAGKPVLAFAGRVWLPPDAVRRLGLDGAYALADKGIPPRVAIRDAARLLESRVAEVLKDFAA